MWHFVRRHLVGALSLGIVFTSGSDSLAQPPATITVQGVVQNPGGSPLSGARDYRVRFFDSATTGSQLGADLAGTTALSSAGRFSIELTPPSQIFSAAGVWYEVAVDSVATPNGIGTNDVFPDRVKVTSVPFARLAGDVVNIGGLPVSQYTTDAELNAAVADLVPNPAVPFFPTNVRMLSSLRGAPYRRLAWNMESYSEVARFLVAESPVSVQNGSPVSLSTSTTLPPTEYFSSTSELELPIYANSGLHFFRVLQLNFAGVAGIASSEFGLDTTSRVAYLADQLTNDKTEVWMAKADGTSNVNMSTPFPAFADADFVRFSPDGRRISYRADQTTDQVFELYAAPGFSGGAATKINAPLVAGGNVISVGDFSPDGERIVYTADLITDEVFEAIVSPALGLGISGKVNSPLVSGGDVVGTPKFSNNGSQIAYRADQDTDEVFELYVAPTFGGGVKMNLPLVTGGDVADGFAFSPDSTRIAYRADQDTDNVIELYAAATFISSTAVKVNPPLVAGGNVTAFLYSPDGSRIAYVADQETDTVYNVYIAPSSGGGTSTKVNPTLAAGRFVADALDFSPDGTRIAYLADQDVDNVFELYVAPASGGGVVSKVNSTLVAGGTVLTGFAFSPEGTRIAYIADQETDDKFELFVAPASGGATSIRVNLPFSSTSDVLDFAFSPDGSLIFYRADQDSDDVFELYVTRASGGGNTLKINPTLVSGGDVGVFAVSPFGIEL